jgi:alpha-glucosidase
MQHLKITLGAWCLLLVSCFYADFGWSQYDIKGKVDTLTVKNSSGTIAKKLWIYLPRNYQRNQKKYPVIYMTDGQNLFESGHGYGGEWRVDETLDSLKAKVIVVGIEHGGSERINELTPWPHAKYGGGKADEFLTFLLETIKPFVDAHFRTKPKASHTAIMGSSLGGLFALYATMKYPAIFGKAAVMSPAIWINRDPILGLINQQESNETRYFFSCGDAEGDPDMIPDMHEAIKRIHRLRCYCLHADTEVIYAGAKHSETQWVKAFRDAYLWLF